MLWSGARVQNLQWEAARETYLYPPSLLFKFLGTSLTLVTLSLPFLQP